MKNNLAELKDVSINLESLRTAWTEQVIFAENYSWKPRNYVSYTFFTVYFQRLLLEIENMLGEKPKDYIIQMHDPSIVINDKWYLNITHKDADRNTCVNIPIYYNHMEPVNFYDNINGSIDKDEPKWPNHHRLRPTKITSEKPNQIGYYSEKHPTLMNVNNFHNVRVLDEQQPI